jgi:DNA-binding response OmpR family regulator
MRILVVEDEPILAEAIVELLADEGHAVDLAATGAAAGALVEVASYDLVLLDSTLPPPSGAELLAAWRAAGRRFAVLVMTGDPRRAADMADLADGQLIKPFSFSVLLDWVRRLDAGRP